MNPPRRLLTCLFALSVATLVARQPVPAPDFVFTHPFWVNLHHFLYVLGRVEAKRPDIQRRAVAGANADQDAGLASLSGDERRAWLGAVTAYARGLSRKDAVFDASLIDVTRAMVAAGDASSLPGGSLDAGLAAVLEQAAPIYRKTWWPAHLRADQARVDELQALLAQHGRPILAYITRAYQAAWPSSGYPVNISGYTNWAGAYSTSGRLLVVSSLDTGTRGASGLETIFHEAMHQWDELMDTRVRAAATRQHVATVPEDLTHAMVFFTAGEAIRAVVPAHVPYAEANGLWGHSGLSALKPILDAAWKPYLDGKGTLDQALDEIFKRLR